MSVITDRHSSW